MGSKQLPNGANLPKEVNKKPRQSEVRVGRLTAPVEEREEREERELRGSRRGSTSSSEQGSQHSNVRLVKQQLSARTRNIINIRR